LPEEKAGREAAPMRKRYEVRKKTDGVGKKDRKGARRPESGGDAKIAAPESRKTRKERGKRASKGSTGRKSQTERSLLRWRNGFRKEKGV